MTETFALAALWLALAVVSPPLEKGAGGILFHSSMAPCAITCF